MKYVVAFGARRRGPALLEGGATRATVAAACRAAALDFMAGVAGGWTKIDLARWLTGPYAWATRHCRHGERTLVSDGSDAAPSSLAPERIDALLASTRGRVLMALKKAALSGGVLELAEEVIDQGFVRRAVDEDAMEVWVPVDVSRMRLLDRVQALFVADHLDDPVAYRTLNVCRHCEAVVFDEGARSSGTCAAHRRMSGIVFRNDEERARAAGQS